jgi:hypothetical protein
VAFKRQKEKIFFIFLPLEEIGQFSFLPLIITWEGGGGGDVAKR